MTFTVEATTTLETLLQECHAYMLSRDIVELTLCLTTTVSEEVIISHLHDLVTSALTAGHCRLKEASSQKEGASVTVYWQDMSIIPIMPNSKYYKWTLPSGAVMHARYFLPLLPLPCRIFRIFADMTSCVGNVVVMWSGLAMCQEMRWEV